MLGSDRPLGPFRDHDDRVHRQRPGSTENHILGKPDTKRFSLREVEAVSPPRDVEYTLRSTISLAQDRAGMLLFQADAMRLSIKFWLRWVDYKREAGVEVGETIGKVR